MLHTFLTTLDGNISHLTDKKFLCAVSGGVDSMVMTDLMLKSNLKFGICHIDHNTRNGQSTEDAIYLSNYCRLQNIRFFLRKIEDDDLKGSNFQSEAREFRYNFLREIADENGYDYILTAHHQDDRWETFIYHLSRAAGLDGLTSLKYLSGDIVRPLIVFTRKEIEAYADKNKVKFVADASNETDIYARNKIRHHITPYMEAVFPRIVSSTNSSMQYLEQEKLLLSQFISEKNYIFRSGEIDIIDINKVKQYQQQNILLYRILKDYNFTRSDINDMLTAKHSGASFSDGQFEGLLHKGKLLIRRIQDHVTIQITINRPGVFPLTENYFLEIAQATNVVEAKAPHLLLDFDKVNFPLKIRNWKSGDVFKPSGMHGNRKKIKDFLTDSGLSKWEKNKILIVEHQDEIIQVIGLRTSHGYLLDDGDKALMINRLRKY